MACGAEGSTHGSTGPSGQMLQTDLRHGCIRKCGSAWSWKEVYFLERPSSRCADPRLVVTHRFSWAQWCKGWKTLPSYRLEGPVPSRPSPVGQWFPSQDMCISYLHCCEVDASELGRTPGKLNRIFESDGPREPARRLGSSPAPRHRTRGRAAKWNAETWPVAGQGGVWVCGAHLPGSIVRQRVRE